MYKQAVLFQYEGPPSKRVCVVLTVLNAHNLRAMERPEEPGF